MAHFITAAFVALMQNSFRFTVMTPTEVHKQRETVLGAILRSYSGNLFFLNSLHTERIISLIPDTL